MNQSSSSPGAPGETSKSPAIFEPASSLGQNLSPSVRIERSPQPSETQTLGSGAYVPNASPLSAHLSSMGFGSYSPVQKSPRSVHSQVGFGNPYGNTSMRYAAMSPISPNTMMHGTSNITSPIGASTSSTQRTLYIGNLPQGTTIEELLSHVKGGALESAKILEDKNCAFVTFLDSNSAAVFHSIATAAKLTIHGQEARIGWGKESSLASNIAAAVAQGASRNVFLGNITDAVTEQSLREDLKQFGIIDTVKVLHEKGIAFVHFANIQNAMKCVMALPNDQRYFGKRVNYGRDRCAHNPPRRGSTAGGNAGAAAAVLEAQLAAAQSGAPMGGHHAGQHHYGGALNLSTNPMQPSSYDVLDTFSPGSTISNSMGGALNTQNRTIYLGNIHPDTTTEDLCNVIRGGILHQVRYIKEKNHAFVSFVDSTSATNFYNFALTYGLPLRNRKLRVGWGKPSHLPHSVSLAVQSGASRNVYLGNIDLSRITMQKLFDDFIQFGEIELVNILAEKQCGFVNFCNISSAVRATEEMKRHPEYRDFRISYGKDRCGNPPRLMKIGKPGGMNSAPVHIASPMGGPSLSLPMYYGPPSANSWISNTASPVTPKENGFFGDFPGSNPGSAAPSPAATSGSGFFRAQMQRLSTPPPPSKSPSMGTMGGMGGMILRSGSPSQSMLKPMSLDSTPEKSKGMTLTASFNPSKSPKKTTDPLTPHPTHPIHRGSSPLNASVEVNYLPPQR